jgi:hypothetical protein
MNSNIYKNHIFNIIKLSLDPEMDNMDLRNVGNTPTSTRCKDLKQKQHQQIILKSPKSRTGNKIYLDWEPG